MPPHARVWYSPKKPAAAAFLPLHCTRPSLAAPPRRVARRGAEGVGAPCLIGGRRLREEAGQDLDGREHRDHRPVLVDAHQLRHLHARQHQDTGAERVVRTARVQPRRQGRQRAQAVLHARGEVVCLRGGGEVAHVSRRQDVLQHAVLVDDGQRVEPELREQRERVGERGAERHARRRRAVRQRRLRERRGEELRRVVAEGGGGGDEGEDLLGEEDVEEGGGARGVAERQALQPVLLEHHAAVVHGVVDGGHHEAGVLAAAQAVQVAQVAALYRLLRVAAAGEAARLRVGHRARRVGGGERAVREEHDVDEVGAGEDIDKPLVE
mmetsp:Transcript_19898/g.47680  ORF Transcript_19898/g.47680 Transcript_19898/m.47680 type:complete len:324 (+) Transcript_19898:494-1465(+)